MKLRLALVLALLLVGAPAYAQAQASSVATQHSHTSASTITVPAPADPTQFVYITGIDITACAGASAVTAAAPTFITTTNLAGTGGVAPQYMVGSGVTAGVCNTTIFKDSATTMRATTAGAAVTFVLPTFATNQTISVNVYYFFDKAR